MNILSEPQARARQLSLPRDGLLTGVSEQFVAELQLHGTFVEYKSADRHERRPSHRIHLLRYLGTGRSIAAER